MKSHSKSQHLTKKERERFDALVNHDTIKSAAESLKMSAGALSTWKWNMKNKYRRLRNRVNAILAQTNRPHLETLLTERKPMDLPDDEMLAEEDLLDYDF